MNGDDSRRPVRFEGTVVFADGRSHLARIFPGGFLQYAGTAEQWHDAEPVLAALAAAFAATNDKDKTDD